MPWVALLLSIVAVVGLVGAWYHFTPPAIPPGGGGLSSSPPLHQW